MPNKPFDDKKHPRDTGKFSRIPGGKQDGSDDVEPPAPDPRDDARQEIKNSITSGAEMRHPQQLRTLGLTSGRAYEAATNATKALHASGDVSVLHHHGKAMQDAVKALKQGGAKPEELEKLRRGLTALHSALSIGDQVAAHEAITGLQHGFYHAYSSFRKEHGMGGFPLIGQEFKDAAARGDQQTKDLEKKHGGPSSVGAERTSYEIGQADRKAREAFRAGYKAALVKFNLDDLPAKPTPEQFDEAIKKAENVKVGSWDHRYIEHGRLLPSENKEPDEKFVEQIKKDPNAAPPIVVKPHGNDYNILDGHHRYFASKKAGHKGMWAVVVKEGDYK